MLENARQLFGAGNTIVLDPATPLDQPGGSRHYPDDVKARYFVAETEDRTTFYRDYKGQEAAFRLDRDKGRMTTRADDISTVRDMMSVAEAEGWKTVSLGGSKEFRREAWIEATTRDIKATGHRPTELDRQEAEKRRARRGREGGADRSERPDSDGPPKGTPNPPARACGSGGDRERTAAPGVPDSNVLSLEIEKATRSTRAVQRDEVRIERDQLRLAEDQARGRPDAVARDEARLQRDDARVGADRANLSDAARSILATLSTRIDKELTGLTGGEKERLKDFTAGLLAAREVQVGRLQDPGPPPREWSRDHPAAGVRDEAQRARRPDPEPELPLPRRHRNIDRSL
jgi:hypothetical protein